MADLQHKRGTKSALDSLAGSNGLLVGQLYFITDENRIAIATSASAYETYAKESELSNKQDAITRATQSNLTCNFASTNYIVATVTGNQSFTLSNVPTDEVVTILIINTGGGDITLPNTADKYSNATWTHSANGIREYSLFYDGTTRYWQVSEELV